MYNSGDHEHTVMWMSEALHKTYEAQSNSTNVGPYRHTVSEADILEYLAFSTYQKGEISNAITLTQRLLDLEPNHPRAVGNVAHYNKLLSNRMGEDGQESDQVIIKKHIKCDSEIIRSFTQLC